MLGSIPAWAGELPGYLAAVAPGGSIPAWAGETGLRPLSIPPPEVYPRVGGGNRNGPSLPYQPEGLSPHGRGKRTANFRRLEHQRSIPAWAGETRLCPPSLHRTEVYPRVGGGNNPESEVISYLPGLSPRGRGKPGVEPMTPPPLRSIPAWAGETGQVCCSAGQSWVYPRVGGGNGVQPYGLKPQFGLSPRGRGKHRPVARRIRRRRSIPAWAGETRQFSGRFGPRTVYPRVGGGNISIGGRLRAASGLSPRGRGKRASAAHSTAYMRSIPAWAGETRRTRRRAGSLKVYPRVGGGN